MRVACWNAVAHATPIAVLVDRTGHGLVGQPGSAGRILRGEQGFETCHRDVKSFDPDADVTGQTIIFGEPAGERALFSKAGIGAGVAPVADEDLIHEPGHVLESATFNVVGGIGSAPHQREGSLGIDDVAGMGLHPAIRDGERRATAEIRGPGRNRRLPVVGHVVSRHVFFPLFGRCPPNEK